MLDNKKNSILDKTLSLSLKQRTFLVTLAGILENIFTFSIYSYLKIWPMVIVVLLGLIAFVACAISVGKSSFATIYITILVYSITAVLVVSFYAEWSYGFQNYLFVPVQLCFAIVYRDSNFKTVLKYAAVTLIAVGLVYFAAMNISFRVKPITGTSDTFIMFVNIVNSFFVFFLNFIFLISLFVELSNESVALNAANTRLEQYADRDPLTNLYNRRFAEKTLNKLTVNDPPLILIMCDIDHFKNVNDTFGHNAGDLILSRTARIILGNISYKDFAIRWGGEEFLLIINNSSMTIAQNTIKRIMTQLQNSQVMYEGKLIETTLTAGLALFSPGKDNYEEIIRQADKRLYIGKESGRNRCVSKG